MQVILLNLHRSHHQGHHFLRHHQIRWLYDAASSMKCVRDRGLDHAVEREKNLKPLLNLKNLIVSEPSKSLPLSLITQSKDSLRIPFRPIEFIRRYTSVFEEFLPGGIGIQPHIKLTPEVLNYNKEEQIVYQSVLYKQDVADRLLKLLMVSRINQIPVRIVDGLRWELGLPQDYLKTIVPEFPDYFRLKNEQVLELVCWNNELSVSEIEKKRMCPIEFPLKYSTGFEMDKKYKKWVDEWQKLPYISPYENASHLPSKSDESDKWAVAILHEILNLFIGKKAEREVVFSLGEWLGLRSRFKRAMLQHPGIFYVSSKNRTHTVVLREAYNRNILVEKVPLMEIRFKYVQLMNAVKEDPASKNVQKKSSKEHQGEDLLEENGNDEEEHGEIYDLSEEDSNDDYEEEEDEDDDDDNEHTERMISKNKKAAPDKKFKGRECLDTSMAGPATRKVRLHLRTEVHDSRSAGPRSLRNLDDNGNNYDERNERMNSKDMRTTSKKSYKGGKSLNISMAGPATGNSGGSKTRFHLRTEVHDSRSARPRSLRNLYDNDKNYDERHGRTNSKDMRTTSEKSYKGRKSLNTSMAGPATGNSGGSKTRFHLRTEVHDSRSVRRRSLQNLDDDDNNYGERNRRMNSKNMRTSSEKSYKGKKVWDRESAGRN